jgi:hypothetical protein
VRLLRVLAGSLRAAAEFHDPPIAGVLGRAADDMVRRSEEIAALTDPRRPPASGNIAVRARDDVSD